MIRSFTVLVSVIILASMMYAQNAPQAPVSYRGELLKGTSYTGFNWTPGVGDFNGKLAAMVSTFNAAGDVQSMPLYGVKYGYFISAGWAIEGVVDFGSSSTSTDVTNGTNKFSATEFGISAFAKYFFQPMFEDVSVWLGGGITFGSISATDETPTATTTKIETTGSSFGIGLDFGAQYFIAKGFSLSANYQLGYLNLNKPEYKVTSTEGNTTTTTTVKGPSGSFFGTMTGSLGINFYF